MNPQLYQSLKLMELPIADLREKIEEELERNPALEVIEDKSMIPLKRSSPEKITAGAQIRRGSDKESDEHRKFIEGALTRAQTLQEHLLWQTNLEPIDMEARTVAETLIQNLNNDGFHIEDPQTLFGACPKSLMDEALKFVRSLDPAGCATGDYKESLKIQLEQKEYLPDHLFTNGQVDIILDNLDLIEREKYSVLAKKTGLGKDDIMDICDLIKHCSPFPGRAFALTDIRYVIPDIKVICEISDDGHKELSIILNDEAFPVLGLNKFYTKLIDSKTKEKSDEKNLAKNNQDAARNFARENVREARLFINHLKRRNQTLIRVAKEILRHQCAFFLDGPGYLAPLTLKDIARELDIHETTVSRASNGKYMQTEWGIFEIRYFFTNSISGTGSGGSSFSKESVKETIKEIITAENRLFSDQEISAILGQKGIALARRTVAKYRKELDMGSSYTRKVVQPIHG